MLNEVKFSRYIETRSNVTEIDLGDFIKCKGDTAHSVWKFLIKHNVYISPTVYVNHRPAFGLSPAQLGEAFKVLGERVGKEQQWSIDRASFLSLLQEKGKKKSVVHVLLKSPSMALFTTGEHLTEMELVECMMTLLGYSENPETDGCFTEDTETAIVSHVPERLSVTNFAEDLLGLST